MKALSIFGLGYVGAVTAACFSSRGHRVIGVDPNVLKVERIQNGRSPIVEGDVQGMIAEGRGAGRISATVDADVAVAESDISFIAVGTPSQRNGKLNLSHVRSVAADIGKALKSKSTLHWIVVRSTVLPGTTEEIIIPAIEEASGKTCGRDFMVCFNPEFLREGSAVADFSNPPFTVIGITEPHDAAPVRELYSHIAAPCYEVPVAAAEMIKYSCNAFHALKIAFANEIGTICLELGIDPKTVAEIFKADSRLNISTAYLNPGFAFGGSCLPKDLRALTYRIKELDLTMPLLDSILPSNAEHIDRAAETVLSLGRRRIGIVGLSFKAGTDDLRESPMVHLVKKLIAEGCELRIWDENVSLGRLIGSNRQFIEDYIPHIGALLSDDLDELLDHGEVIVVGSDIVPRDEILSRLGDRRYLADIANLRRPVVSTGQKTPILAEKL